MKEVRYCTHWKRRGRRRDSAYRICEAHLRGLWLDVGEPMSARSLLRRSWHPLQPLRWRGRGGRGSRPLARFTTCQDDGSISLLSSRTNHFPHLFLCKANILHIKKGDKKGNINSFFPLSPLYPREKKYKLLFISPKKRYESLSQIRK